MSGGPIQGALFSPADECWWAPERFNAAEVERLRRRNWDDFKGFLHGDPDRPKLDPRCGQPRCVRPTHMTPTYTRLRTTVAAVSIFEERTSPVQEKLFKEEEG